MSVADIAAISLSALTAIALALQWKDSTRKASEAQLSTAKAEGRAEAQFQTMSASIKALHRRWDEDWPKVVDHIQSLRETLISLGHLAPSKRSISRPPMPEDET